MALSQTAIKRVQHVSENVERVRSFFDAAAVGEALRALDWGPAEEMEMLVMIVRTAENPWVRLKALQALTARAEQVARASGIIEENNAYLEGHADSTKLVLERRAMGLLPGAADRQKDYEETPDEQDIIDAEIVTKTPETPEQDAEIPTNPDSSTDDVPVDTPDGGFVVGINEGHFPPRRSEAGLAGRRQDRHPGLRTETDG